MDYGRIKRYSDLNLKVEIPALNSGMKGKEFLDWVDHVERVFVYKNISDKLNYKGQACSDEINQTSIHLVEQK